MKKSKISNYLIILFLIISTIIVVFLFFNPFSKKEEINFSITDEKIELKLGETKKINYTLSDNNIKIDWNSSNNNIKINSSGEIEANDYGYAVITGSIKNGDETITNTCIVTVYSGEIGVSLEKINYPEGEILMKLNSEIDIPFDIVPANAYITSKKLSIDDSNIAIINENKIISKSEGTTYLRAVFNNNYSIAFTIKVSNNNKENNIAKEVKSISINEKDLTMEIGDVKTLSYNIDPIDGYVDSVKWSSSNENIISVNDGEIRALNVGEGIVKVVINNNIEDEINVKVKATNANLLIDYNPKLLLRIGENTEIKSHIEPNINEEIVYTSSNSSVAKVNNGIITGVGEGEAIITMSISNGKSKTFNINVLPKIGYINGSANFWGYKSLNAKTPVLADSSFYQSLAQNGTGIMQGNIYTITDSGEQFTYDISSSLLKVSNKKIKVRIYYPKNEDLSILNTLVYMGGRGETNFGGVFADIEKNPSLVKSAGIIALLAEGNNTSFDGDSGAYVTKFIKAITKQKSGVKNSILGFSDGAHKVLHASNKETYDKIIIFSGYTDYVSSVENAKDKEIIFMIGSGDGNYSQAKTAINNMLKFGYKNITIVSMGNDLTKYQDKILVINPGNLMKNGHYSINVLNSGIIEYAND